MELEKLKTLLECPVCMEISSSPIYNCKTGHIICHNCAPKVKYCSICRQEYIGTRNFIAEKLALECSFTCRYSNQGCPAVIKGGGIGEHETNCDYRPLNCIVNFCKGGPVNNFSEYFKHLCISHGMLLAPLNTSVWEREMHVGSMRQIIRDITRRPAGMNCFGQQFIQCLQSDNNNVWIWVALCGLEKDTESYEATLKIRSRSADIEKLEVTWTGPVHNIRKNAAEVYASGLCLTTNTTVIKSLIEEQDGKQFWRLMILMKSITKMHIGRPKVGSVSTGNALTQSFSGAGQKILKFFSGRKCISK